MKIGIIGAGRIGQILSRQLSAIGHDVHIANSRGPETLADLASEVGATASSREDAVRDADAVILTIPLHNVTDLPPGLFDLRKNGAPIVDTGNYDIPRDGRIDGLIDGSFGTESQWVAAQLGAPVVKAFNNINYLRLRDLPRPAGDSERIALPVFGDEPGPKAVVTSLIDAIGFDPVDGGPLDESWRVQILTPGFCTDLQQAALEQALADATPDDNSKGYREPVLSGKAPDYRRVQHLADMAPEQEAWMTEQFLAEAHRATATNS